MNETGKNAAEIIHVLFANAIPVFASVSWEYVGS